MEPKKLPIGIHDFAKIITEGYYFIDKSLFIKEILDSGAAVTLLPRPRRFGKTINMSMARYFFEQTTPSIHFGLRQNTQGERGLSNRHLFNNLKIEQYPDCMARQGQYPVIFLTFKDVKESSWKSCLTKLKLTVANEVSRHFEVIESHLKPQELVDLNHLIKREAEQAIYENALKDLSTYLHRAYGKRPIVLIDEYDAPIHAAVDNEYYDEIVDFMRGFLSGGLKDNSDLEFGVLTGILRIGKESIFSGLNNLLVSTLLDEQYSDKFGLLEHEVKKLLGEFGLESKLPDVKSWYDGYQSGPHKIYNPWSIINFAYKKGVFSPYWVNTSGNALLKQIMQQGNAQLKEDFEQIIRNEPLTKEIDDTVVIADLFTNERAAWNLLLMSGYLTFENYRPDPTFEGSHIAELKIPNTEIMWIYKTQILSWFEGGTSRLQYRSMLQSLVDGRLEDFKELFDEFSMQTLSVFDATGKNPEKFYHGLVLGMLASLRDSHEVVSNRESGLGRYDVSLFPRDIKKPGIIIEFKAVSKHKKETLKTAAQSALKQINDRQYETAMRARGITTIIKIGIAFQGKKNLVVIE